jgi:hypothetical protein
MPNLIRSQVTELVAARSLHGLGSRAGVDAGTRRQLAAVGRDTMVRAAAVQGHAIVQTEKLHEIDRLTREAMTGQALLSRWAATLAQGDPFLADDLKFFADVARLGKGEVIADTISDFCHEGRQ